LKGCEKKEEGRQFLEQTGLEKGESSLYDEEVVLCSGVLNISRI
jgi:hypothetical protein